MRFELGDYTVDIGPRFVVLSSLDETRIDHVERLLRLYLRGESVDGKEPPAFSVQIVSHNEIQLNGCTFDAIKALNTLGVVPDENKIALYKEVFLQFYQQFLVTSGLELPDLRIVLEEAAASGSDKVHQPVSLGRT